jgi:CheY-like chemotaxis protein
MTSKKIALVGHCGPDASYLMMTVRRAVDGAQVVMVDDDQQLAELLKKGVDLVLMNRELNYGFDESFGVDVIRRLRAAHPHVRMMLVTNYPDVQADAIAAGALPGFGKRELGTPRVVDVLRAALE